MHPNRSHLCSRLALALALPTSIAAQGLIRSHPGTISGGRSGTAVASAGDVDMDGYDDVVIGAPYATVSAGRVEVRSGRTGAVLFAVPGSASLARLGLAVAGAGDVNGDGHDDVIAGAPNSFPFAVAPGYAVVLSGSDGAVLHRFNGTSNGETVGFAVAGVGDIDDDGRDDVAVGVPLPGRVDFYSGRTGVLLRAVQFGATTDNFGAALARVGDLDGDGIDDVIVGAPNANASGGSSGSGNVRILSGRTGLVLRSIDGDSPGDGFGTAVGGGYDVTGDGVPDFVVGAPGDDNNGADSGSVRLYSGATGLAVFTRDGAGLDRLGTAVAIVGDMDGDGRAEFAAGAPQPPFIAPTLPGYVRVWSSTGTVLFTVLGDGVDDRMGTAVAAAGDVDRNGLADLIAGAPLADPAGADSGLARIYRRNVTVNPGRFEDYGRGCPGADGRLPRTHFTGRPSLGQNYTVGVRSAPLGAPGILRVAFGRNNLDLAFIGAPNCLLLTQFFVDLSIVTDGAGRAGVTLPIPPVSSNVGVVVNYQWSLFAPGANALGVITSDGGEMTIGPG